MSVLDGTPIGTPPQVDEASDSGTPDQTLITVKVNGEDQQVTLDELRGGYMRQADYTVKTQDLANARKQLEQAQIMADALDRNPQQAIETIASHYGVQVGANPQRTAQPVDATDQFDEYGDPIAAPTPDPQVAALHEEIRALKEQVSGVSVNQQATLLEKDLERLEATYGDVDRTAVLRHMQVNNLPTPELAYRDLHWENAQQALAATREREAAEARILEEKRAQQGLVSVGAGVASGGLESPPKVFGGNGLQNALREAFQDTKAELGIDSLAGLRFNE
jgi:hypothetical protein